MIRPAQAADCAAMTRILHTSNAYTGDYRKIIEPIQITPERLTTEQFFVYESDGQIAGFYSVIDKGTTTELDFMFVDNDFMGKGIGRALFEHLRSYAREQGYQRIEIVAHPPAEAFYARMGAVTRGVKPPQGRVTWSRPHMWLEITPE